MTLAEADKLKRLAAKRDKLRLLGVVVTLVVKLHLALLLWNKFLAVYVEGVKRMPYLSFAAAFIAAYLLAKLDISFNKWFCRLVDARERKAEEELGAGL